MDVMEGREGGKRVRQMIEDTCTIQLGGWSMDDGNLAKEATGHEIYSISLETERALNTVG